MKTENFMKDIVVIKQKQVGNMKYINVKIKKTYQEGSTDQRGRENNQ